MYFSESNKELLNPFFSSSKEFIKPSENNTWAMFLVIFVEGICTT
jgi:hypothetical protein